MSEAFSKTFRGAPYKSLKFKKAAMKKAVQAILQARGINFMRGVVEVDKIIQSISRLATGETVARTDAQPKLPIITKSMMVAMTIEIAKASKAIFGDPRVLRPDSLRNISIGLAFTLRQEGGYCVSWSDELPINWQHEFDLFERERADSLKRR